MKHGTFKYVRMHFKPDSGVENLSAEDALRLAGEEPDHHVKDVYNAIERAIIRFGLCIYKSWSQRMRKQT